MRSRAVRPLGFALRARLAERQAILIEGVTRFVTRDARCNSVMQAVIPLAQSKSSPPGPPFARARSLKG